MGDSHVLAVCVFPACVVRLTALPREGDPPDLPPTDKSGQRIGH